MTNQDYEGWVPVEDTYLALPSDQQVRNLFDEKWGEGTFDRWRAHQSARLLKGMADEISAEMPNAPSMAQTQRMRYFVGYLTAAAESHEEQS